MKKRTDLQKTRHRQPNALAKREMLECLQRSGYLMEGRLAKALQGVGCFVEPNLSFPDPRTGVSREIDMVTEPFALDSKTPGTCVKTTFIIEAINNLYPILLLTPKGWSPNTDPSYNLRYKITPLDDDQVKHPFATEFDVLEWHGVYNWKLFCQYCSFSRKKQGGELMASHPEDLHTSIRKAAEYLLYTENDLNSWMDKRKDDYWRIFQWRALMVVQNDLYVLSDDKHGAAALTKIKHAKLEYNLHYGDTPTSVVLDFIVEEAVPEFVRQVELKDQQLSTALHRHRAP